MKRAIILILAFANLMKAPCQGVQFRSNTTWEQLQAEAKMQNKYIFVDCFASWCLPCRAMDKDVYSDSCVGQFINDRFISVKVQMDSTKHDNDQIKKWYADAHTLASQYRPTAYPSFLFFSPSGQIVHRGQGYKDIKNFLQLSAEALDSSNQFYTLLKIYHAGLMSNGQIKKLAQIAISIGDTIISKAAANQYITRINKEELFTLENVDFVWQFTSSINDAGFKIFRNYPERISQIERQLDTERINVILQSILYRDEIMPFTTSKNGRPDWHLIKAKIGKYGELGLQALATYTPVIIFNAEIKSALLKDPNWEDVLAKIKRQHLVQGREFLIGSCIVYYLNNIDYNFSNFMASAQLYDNLYPTFMTAITLNDWAWLVFQHSKDSVILNIALSWSKRAVQMSNMLDPADCDTYANLLYKLGHSEEAINWEKKAVSMAPGAKDITENYRKMCSGIPTWTVQ